MTFKKIHFVTDSTCDIPLELAEKWHITVVPAFVNYGGASYADYGDEKTRAEYYTMLATAKEIPTTAAPSSGMAEEAIRNAFLDADHVVMITAPAKLSGIYNAFRLGASTLSQNQVTLIDSGTVSSALGWQVVLGAEVAAETGDVQKTLDAIARVRAHSKIYAAIATVDYLRRSGRVNRLIASLGSLLQIKPILEVEDGEVNPAFRVRTFGKALEKLADLARSYAPLDRLTVLHSNNLEGAQQVKKMLSDCLPPNTVTIVVNTALGTHIGPGAVGVAPVSRKWRQ